MGYISCGDFMKGKLIRDRRFNPSYTREEATRIYDIAYRKYSRGYVRASTEKMLYMADKCFWQQFWPTDEFPGEKAWIVRDATEKEAIDEYEDAATRISRQLEEEGTQYRQKETASPWIHTFSNQNEKVQVLVKTPIRHIHTKRKVTNTSEDTRSSSTGTINSEITRSFTNFNFDRNEHTPRRFECVQRIATLIRSSTA
ncbi:hypothetical protein DID88_008514 [Monilinia fructigena]|uniref:Uncharacterized protein n=1 Tax=Monilinia fructigena TaxID=38457 RepID=A0A395J5M7_9HELO|nr:hypothetical protein DID88_008514 [Monilinia fructigena]